MSDDWEDWENNDFTVPVLNQEQSKRLAERKLVEECDNVLTRDLFSKDNKDLIVKQNQIINKNVINTVKKTPKKNAFNKQKENEEKQKELSKKNKDDKLRRERAREIFGEAEDDEYSKYEDMFY